MEFLVSMLDFWSVNTCFQDRNMYRTRLLDSLMMDSAPVPDLGVPCHYEER